MVAQHSIPASNPTIHQARPMCLVVWIRIIGVQNIPKRCMKIDAKDKFHTSVFRQFEQIVSCSSCFLLNEGRPVPIEVDAIDVMPPMAKVIAVRVDPRHAHNLVFRTKPLCQRIITKEKIYKGYLRLETGKFRRVLPTQNDNRFLILYGGCLITENRLPERTFPYLLHLDVRFLTQFLKPVNDAVFVENWLPAHPARIRTNRYAKSSLCTGFV